MTRLQARQLEEALQKSNDAAAPSGPSSSSTVPNTSSGAWLRDDLLKSTMNAFKRPAGGFSGADALGSLGSESMTSYEDAVPHKGNGLQEIEGMASTDDDRQRAQELGLAPSPSPAGFFDSSQDPTQPAERSTAASDKVRPRQPTIVPEVVINTSRFTSRVNPARVQELSGSAADAPVTPLVKAKKGKGSGSSRRDSVAPSEASTSIGDDGDVDLVETPSACRPRRSAAKAKNYAPICNPDGTEIKISDKKAKGSIGKETKKSSSRTPQPSSGKGSQAEEPIVIDDEDQSEEDEDEVMQPVQSQKSSGVEKTVAEEDEQSDEDEIVSSRARAAKGKASKPKGNSAVADEDEQMVSEDEGDQQVSARSRSTAKTNGRTGKQRMQDADDEEDEEAEATPRSSTNEANAESVRKDRAVPVVEVETPASKGRRAKKTPKSGKSKKQEVAAAEEKEDEVVADAETEDVGEEEEEEEEGVVQPAKQPAKRSKGRGSKKALVVEEEPPEKGSKGESTVLADASSSVNAGRRGAKTADANTASPSTSSTSTPAKSGILDAARRLWGKPLTSLLGTGTHRSPGLAKRKIAPLLSHRGAPPPKRAAIPIPKSRQRKNGEELDSDEEAARANETPEERMARYIREQDEGD